MKQQRTISLPFKVESIEELRTAHKVSRVLMGCLATNMAVQAGFIGYKIYQFTDFHQVNSDLMAQALLGCYAAWIIVSIFGGAAGLYAAVTESLRAARACLLAWIFMIVCQICEVTITLCYLAPHTDKTWPSERLLLLDTAVLCVIELIFIAFVQLFISLRLQRNNLSYEMADDAYVPLLDLEESNEPIVCAQPIMV